MDDELKQYLETMKHELSDHVTKECEKVETRLLHAFHGWARSMDPGSGRLNRCYGF